jgi:hypothetical protein
VLCQLSYTHREPDATSGELLPTRGEDGLFGSIERHCLPNLPRRREENLHVGASRQEGLEPPTYGLE